MLAAAGHRAIAVDLRGHGRSDGADQATSYTTAAMVGALAAIIATLGIDRPVMVGHSMSGRITLQYALDHPGAVRGLALLAPIGVGSLRPSIELFASRSSRRAAGSGRSPSGGGSCSCRQRGDWPPAAPSRRDIDEYWAPSQWGKYCIAIHAILRDFDWRALGAATIARLPIPLVVVLGELDPLVVIADREALTEGSRRSGRDDRWCRTHRRRRSARRR